jgi:hypothetical protein
MAQQQLAHHFAHTHLLCMRAHICHDKHSKQRLHGAASALTAVLLHERNHLSLLRAYTVVLQMITALANVWLLFCAAAVLSTHPVHAHQG